MKKLGIILPVLLLSTVLLAGCNKNNTQDDLSLQDQLEAIETQNQDLSIPDWVKDLDIDAPDGLELLQEESYQTTEKLEGFNSIHFAYQGDYDTAMQQAELIAQKAGVSISQEFQMAQEMMAEMGDQNTQMQELMGELKGAVYTNYNLMEKPTEDYIIAITVDEDGKLEIDVADRAKMEDIAQDYTR
ncbi:MAG TPA: hypothetical protein P5060_02780 [Candidatus Absconditabacterales bacterium]|nr:hypothetical protein [Candidatus Absconditabacterales bacterium]